MTRISDAFAAVLRAGREDFNAQFVQARHQCPTLSTDAFAEFLSTGVDPVIRAVAAVAPDRTEATVTAAYEIGLELVSRNLAGPAAKHDVVTRAWQGLLPMVAGLVAAAPRRVLGAVSNALCHLAANSGARPAWWLEEMARMSQRTTATGDVENFLRLGQVVAWRAGMAHFRAGALATLNAMPEPLACLAVGVPNEIGVPWTSLHARLEADPWFVPSAGESAAPAAAHLASRAGGFRGFGGLFTEPPRVAGGEAGHFFICSAEAHWLLTADAFGATFHRAKPEEFAAAAARPASLPGGVSLDSGGVLFRRQRVEWPFCGEITSHAVNSSTLAVTASLTHAVLLVALDPFAPA